MKKTFKQEKAITLIALVITIIVLLILAGVTIVTLTGDNGLLQKTTAAEEKNDEATALEKVQIEVAGSYGLDGNIDVSELNKNLMNINGLTYNGKAINTNQSDNDNYNIIEKLPVIVKLNNINIAITSNSTVQKPVYLSDGLILRYDGIENTRNGNNPNATSWEDLSGNENDGIFSNAMVSNQSTITEFSKGYYSPEENGYVFLHNDAYIKSKNNIGISGDANFTIEVVMKPWSNLKNANYSRNISWISPLWFGNSSAVQGGSVQPQYTGDYKFGLDYMNNGLFSDSTYHDVLDHFLSLSSRKIKTGVINSGDKNTMKIFYNGSFESLNLNHGTIYVNILNSSVEVGRAWQWEGQNRTFYGSIQAIRIYDRVLTDEEVTFNYSIDRERFNID